MCGSAMLTMVMSSTTISWHEQMTRRAIPLPRPVFGVSAVVRGVAWEPVMGLLARRVVAALELSVNAVVHSPDVSAARRAPPFGLTAAKPRGRSCSGSADPVAPPALSGRGPGGGGRITDGVGDVAVREDRSPGATARTALTRARKPRLVTVDGDVPVRSPARDREGSGPLTAVRSDTRRDGGRGTGRLARHRRPPGRRPQRVRRGENRPPEQQPALRSPPDEQRGEQEGPSVRATVTPVPKKPWYSPTRPGGARSKERCQEPAECSISAATRNTEPPSRAVTATHARSTADTAKTAQVRTMSAPDRRRARAAVGSPARSGRRGPGRASRQRC